MSAFDEYLASFLAMFASSPPIEGKALCLNHFSINQPQSVGQKVSQSVSQSVNQSLNYRLPSGNLYIYGFPNGGGSEVLDPLGSSLQLPDTIGVSES